MVKDTSCLFLLVQVDLLDDRKIDVLAELYEYRILIDLILAILKENNPFVDETDCIATWLVEVVYLHIFISFDKLVFFDELREQFIVLQELHVEVLKLSCFFQACFRQPL